MSNKRDTSVPNMQYKLTLSPLPAKNRPYSSSQLIQITYTIN